MDEAWSRHLREQLDQQARLNLTRRMVAAEGPIDTEVVVGGRKVLNFCSNDYLGYTQHPALKDAACRAAREWGAGAGASRLVSGNLGLYVGLEEDLARFKHADEALVFPTGFMANLGIVAGLASKGDVILSDALNHASLVDACRLSRAEVRIIPHANAGAYEDELKKLSGRRVLLVTDGVFSMDGDVAPLPELVEISRRFGALLVIDDAHGTGVLGSSGRGSLEYFGLDPAGIIQMGTFSKALGSLGGFVAGPKLAVEFLRNRARTLFYTTGLPPAVLAVNRRSLQLVDEEPGPRQRLAQNAKQLSTGLKALGLTIIEGPSAIVPALIGEADRALALSSALMDKGLFCPAIRPPTVPPGQSRLRLSLMATHTPQQIDRALDLINEAIKEVGL